MALRPGAPKPRRTRPRRRRPPGWWLTITAGVLWGIRTRKRGQR